MILATVDCGTFVKQSSIELDSKNTLIIAEAYLLKIFVLVL